MPSLLILLVLSLGACVAVSAAREDVVFDYAWRWKLYDAPQDVPGVAASCTFAAAAYNSSAQCDLSGMTALHFTPQGRLNADDCRRACCAMDACQMGETANLSKGGLNCC